MLCDMIGRNNPFNIRYNPKNKWKGQDGDTRGFCNFVSLEFGVRAAAYLLIKSYRQKGLVTYSEIISRFAPSSENETGNYISFVCSKLHVFPFDEVSSLGAYAGLLHYMWIFEQGSGYVWSSQGILKVLLKFKFKV